VQKSNSHYAPQPYTDQSVHLVTSGQYRST